MITIGCAGFPVPATRYFKEFAFVEIQETLLAQPGMDLWQLHESRNEGAQNAPDAFIANVDDGITSYWIKLTARDDGGFEVLNSRTGFLKKYRPIHSK